MLNKTIIALAATVVLGSASAAFAQYTGYSNHIGYSNPNVPENIIGDRYPFLERVNVAQAKRRITGTAKAKMHRMKKDKM